VRTCYRCRWDVVTKQSATWRWDSLRQRRRLNWDVTARGLDRPQGAARRTRSTRYPPQLTRRILLVWSTWLTTYRGHSAYCRPALTARYAVVADIGPSVVRCPSRKTKHGYGPAFYRSDGILLNSFATFSQILYTWTSPYWTIYMQNHPEFCKCAFVSPVVPCRNIDDGESIGVTYLVALGPAKSNCLIS